MLLLGSKVMLWTQLSLIHSHECGVAISRAYLWWKKFRFFVFSRALGMKINRSASVCPWFQYVQSAPKGQTHNTCTNVRWTYAPVNERHFYIFTKYVFFVYVLFFPPPWRGSMFCAHNVPLISCYLSCSFCNHCPELLWTKRCLCPCTETCTRKGKQ